MDDRYSAILIGRKAWRGFTCKPEAGDVDGSRGASFTARFLSFFSLKKPIRHRHGQEMTEIRLCLPEEMQDIFKAVLAAS